MSKIIAKYPFELDFICTECATPLEIAPDELGDFYLCFPCKHSKPIAFFFSRLSKSIFSTPSVKRFGDKNHSISLVLEPPEKITTAKSRGKKNNFIVHPDKRRERVGKTAGNLNGRNKSEQLDGKQRRHH
jgi:hypothetical protein